jgi:Protein of unknown function (DUF1326)
MGYDIKGKFVEACDCEVICSCWTYLKPAKGAPHSVEPDMGSCTGLYGWTITQGTSNGVLLDGCQVLMLFQGVSCDNAAHILILIDGSAVQRAELRTALDLGPWKRLIGLGAAKVAEIVDGKISIGPKQLSADIDPPDPTRSIDVDASYDWSSTQISDTDANSLTALVTGAAPKLVTAGQISTVPGSRGLNMLAEARSGGKSYIFDLDMSAVSVMGGAFHYVHP